MEKQERKGASEEGDGRESSGIASLAKQNRIELHQPVRITTILPNDILLGRGAFSIGNEGNIRFRNLVSKSKMDYINANRRSLKDKIARDVLSKVTDRRGRFLIRCSGGGHGWVLAEDAVILQKVKQSLRDKEPDPRNKDSEGRKQRSSPSPSPEDNSKQVAARRKRRLPAEVANESPKDTIGVSTLGRLSHSLQPTASTPNAPTFLAENIYQHVLETRQFVRQQDPLLLQLNQMLDQQQSQATTGVEASLIRVLNATTGQSLPANQGLIDELLRVLADKVMAQRSPTQQTQHATRVSGLQQEQLGQRNSNSALMNINPQNQADSTGLLSLFRHSMQNATSQSSQSLPVNHPSIQQPSSIIDSDLIRQLQNKLRGNINAQHTLPQQQNRESREIPPLLEALLQKSSCSQTPSSATPQAALHTPQNALGELLRKLQATKVPKQSTEQQFQQMFYSEQHAQHVSPQPQQYRPQLGLPPSGSIPHTQLQQQQQASNLLSDAGMGAVVQELLQLQQPTNEMQQQPQPPAELMDFLSRNPSALLEILQSRDSSIEDHIDRKPPANPKP